MNDSPRPKNSIKYKYQRKDDLVSLEEARVARVWARVIQENAWENDEKLRDSFSRCFNHCCSIGLLFPPPAENHFS